MCRCGGTRAYIYLCFLLRPVGFCFSKILHLCHLGVTKSACPTDAEKCPPTAICPYSRWRSQPLSRVSRKQRYNTLDFASKIVCQQGCFAPLLETQRQRRLLPSALPLFQSPMKMQLYHSLHIHSLLKHNLPQISSSGEMNSVEGYVCYYPTLLQKYRSSRCCENT